MNIQEAAQYLNTKESLLEEFDVEDPFNLPNTLQGFICHEATEKYGMLLIYSVNNKVLPNPHIVWSIPKLHYPFTTKEDGTRVYNWPKNVEQIISYKKWDGSAIVCYSYPNIEGFWFKTVKTRLTPVLKSGRFGDWVSLWKKILSRSPDTHYLRWQRFGNPAVSKYISFVFELCGYLNPHLIEYPFDLRAIPLMSISTDEIGEYYSINPYPWKVDQETIYQDLLNIGNIYNKANLTELYEGLRKQAQETLNFKEEGGFGIGSQEGFVLYVLDSEDQYHLYKCKPEDIEKIHWSTDSIDENSLRTTCINALENISYKDLNMEFVNKLLEEEFSQSQIAKSQLKLYRIIQSVQGWYFLLDRVDSLMKTRGEFIKEEAKDKREIMRYLSKYFKREEMSHIYQAVKQLGYLDE